MPLQSTTLRVQRSLLGRRADAQLHFEIKPQLQVHVRRRHKA